MTMRRIRSWSSTSGKSLSSTPRRGSRWYIFFFQAEDGIRDYKVTGVQTCALPICDEHDVECAVECAPGRRRWRRYAVGKRERPAAVPHDALGKLAVADDGQVRAEIGRASCRERV